MKRLITLMAAFVAASYLCSAQTSFDGITLNDVELNRNENLMSVNMDVDFTEFDVSTNKAVLYTPVLTTRQDTASFPSVGIYGRNRYYYYVRNDRQLADSTAETSFNEKDLPDYLPYFASVPYLKWMPGAELKMEKKTFGCCGKLISTEYYPLSSYRVYVPSFLYMEAPRSNAPKFRSLEGNASIDYPVSETVIYPDYHDNRRELAKVVSQIDSVRLDADVSIKSIFIKGYASPESPYDNNTRLARGRTEAIREYVCKLYDIASSLIHTDYEPENWEELRTWVEASSLPHRRQILQLIDMDEEPDRKEWLIKSRYKDDYAKMLSQCYPFLRRTYYRIDYEVRSFGETDVEHIRALVTTRPQNLSLEEFYLATKGLDPQSELYAEIFDVAAKMYPEDPVANINAANAAMQRGDLKSAAKYIGRAGNIPEAIYARGVLSALEGDADSARSFLKTASALGLAQADEELAKLEK